MANIKILKSDEFESEVLNSDKVTVVDFFATWCNPCRALAPILETAKTELGDKVNVVKIDVDESEDIARKYGVMSIPTMVVIKNGKELDRMVGLLNKQAIIDRVNKNL